MKSKKTLLVLFAAIGMLMASPLFAQNKSNDERAKTMTEKMKKDLSLTDDQYDKVYNINLAFVNKVSALRGSGGGRLAKARKMKDADAERDRSLKGVLTEEQYSSFKEQKADNREQMKQRRQERKG